MSDVAIRVEGLGKRYRIGAFPRYKALRDTLTNAVAAPFRLAARALKGEGTTDTTGRSDHTIWALKDVSFEVKRGEVVGIIGDNGAGKSTLLKILSRITEPTRGYAELHGRVGSLLEVGTGFHPELTGRENIYLNGAILGMRKTEIERKFDEIVAFAEVEPFIDTPVKYYSTGMCMRLAFAVAAHLEPEIMLIDEVLAVGDADFQKKCLGKMEDVSRRGRTVLFVSHNIAAIRALCATGLLLKGGTLYSSGGIEGVVNLYLNVAPQRGPERFCDARDGAGIVKCEIFAVKNGMETTGELFADQAMGIRFTVRNARNKKEKIALGGRLTDVAGTPIGSVYSDYFGIYFDSLPDQLLEVEVVNEGVRLAPGKYLFWPEIWADEGLVSSPIARVSFTVYPADVFGGGYTGIFHGPALWKAVWRRR